MSLISRALRQSGLYVLFQGAARSLSFITFPIMTRLLTVEDYGTLALVNAVLFMVLGFAKCGMTTSFIRHYPKYDTPYKVATLFTTSLIGVAVTSTLVVAFFYIAIFFFRETIDPRILHVLWWLGLLIIIQNVYSLLSAWLRAEERVATLGGIDLVNKIGTVSLGLVLYVYCDNGLADFFIGLLLFQSIVVAIVIYMYFKRNVIKTIAFEIDVLKILYIFGFPLIFYEVSSLLNDYSDRFLINYFLGAKEVGIYSAGYNLSMAVQSLLTAPLWMSIFPIYSKLWEKEGKQETEKFLSILLKYYICVAIFIISFFAVSGKELIFILASEKYLASAQVVPFVICGVMIYGTFHITGAGFFLMKKTRRISSFTFLAAIINCGLNLFFIPSFGIMGAAYSTIISYVILSIMLTVDSKKLLNIKWPLKDSLLYIAFSFIMIMSVSFIPVGNHYVNFIYKFIVAIFVYTGCVLFFDKNIRRVVPLLWEKIKHFREKNMI